MRRVLAPDLTFDALVVMLERLGWQRQSIPGLRPPLRANEPEQARFTTGDKRLIYSFNPVIDLRILDGDCTSDLPGVDAQIIADWIDSQDARTAARGCIAAAELNLTHFAEAVARAVSTLPEALEPVGQAALRRLKPLPDPSDTAVFDVLTPQLKTRLLRRLLSHHPAAAAAVVPKCWADGPELAATAMIAAARLGLSDQGLAIRRADLSGMGHTGHDREVFRALKKACLATLSGGQPTQDATPKMQFWRQVLGQEAQMDDAGLLIHSLATSQPEVDIPAAPDGFCTIPVVPHWLGHLTGRGLANPLRRWSPEKPVTLMSEATGLVTIEDIPEKLADLSRITGHTLRLPTVPEWEAALRGPTGQPYPWGVSGEFRSLPVSPWGAVWSGQPEWAMCGDGPTLCGADHTGRVAYVEKANPNSKAALRGVIL